MQQRDLDQCADRLRDHYERPYHRGVSLHATHSSTAENPLCGDRIQISLAISPSGTIDELYFDGTGCCISLASASMLVEALEHKNVSHVARFTPTDLLAMLGIPLSSNREQCALLPLRALIAAIRTPIAL